MLKVECESCSAPYQVDERRVPAAGLKMRCPKCGHTFRVNLPEALTHVSSSESPPDRFTRAKPSALGASDDLPATRAAMPRQPSRDVPRPPPLPTPPTGGAEFNWSLDDDLVLPTTKKTLSETPFAGHGQTAGVATTHGTPRIAPATLGSLDDIGLPAFGQAAAKAGAAWDTGVSGLPSPLKEPSLSGGMMPTGLATDSNRATGYAGSEGPQANVGLGEWSDLPSRGDGAVATLPSVSYGHVGIDYPSARGSTATADAPHQADALSGPASGPGTLRAGSDMTTLPSLSGGNLPAPALFEDPFASFGGVNLPAGPGSLPVPAVVGSGRDQVVTTGGGPNEADFGDLDLPGDSFGESAPASVSRTSQTLDSVEAALGGVQFGEVDLGGDGDAVVVGQAPAVSGGPAYQEASLESVSALAAAAAVRPRIAADSDEGWSRGRIVVAATIALVLLGGGGLHFTPVGAFRHVYVSDMIHAGTYARDASRLASTARQSLASDVYPAAVAVARDLEAAHSAALRNYDLSSHLSFVVLCNYWRFGGDPSVAARARGWLGDIPPSFSTATVRVARASQFLAFDDTASASAELSSLQERDVPAELRADVALLRGHVAFARRSLPEAVAAYEKAVSLEASARARFGLARAWSASNAIDKALAELDALSTLSAAHVGSRILKAEIFYEVRHDHEAALKELAVVKDASALRSQASSRELAKALTLSGRILLELDRTTAARAAFEDAASIEPQNVAALVGQGETLYLEGRFAEALSRFDAAVQRDPNDVSAVVGAAKTKLSLERLADAKAQLTISRRTAPNDTSVAVWLAKTELLLGDRTTAESLYVEALRLSQAQPARAIEAYAAYATFLASLGKVGEAQAQLDKAREKLPDSPMLRRALGDVAISQGQFLQALAHYQGALAKSPDDLASRLRLGGTLRRLGRFAEAAAELDRIVAVDPTYPNVALERGFLFERSNEMGKALEQYKKALEARPKDPDLMLRVGVANVVLGNIDDAINLLVQVREARPSSAETLHYLGRAYLAQGGSGPATALPYLARAVALDPNQAEYHWYLAWAANEVVPAQLGMARVHAEKALLLDKSSADAHWQRGLVSLREGAIESALQDLNRATALGSKRHQVHAALAEAYEQKNQSRAAIAEWAKALEGDSSNAFWHFKYGKLMLELNNASEAAKHLMLAVETEREADQRPGWLPRAVFEAAEAQSKSGQRAKSVVSYNLFLDIAGPGDPNRRDALRALERLGAPRSE